MEWRADDRSVRDQAGGSAVPAPAIVALADPEGRPTEDLEVSQEIYAAGMPAPMGIRVGCTPSMPRLTMTDRGRRDMADKTARARWPAAPGAWVFVSIGLLVRLALSYPPVNLPGFYPNDRSRPPRCPTCGRAAEWGSRRRFVAECVGARHRYAVRQCDTSGCSAVATSLHEEMRAYWRCAAGHQFAKRLCPCCGQFADMKGGRGWWRCRTSGKPFSVHECGTCANVGRQAYACRLKGERATICELIEHPRAGR